jgi:hypothetical protein
MALGAAAGAAGTILLQLFREGSQRMLPADAIPPIKEHPGKFMLRKAERLLPRSTRRKIPEQVKPGLSNALGFGYGTTFGALYATSRPETKRTIWEGLLLGLATWMVGYLGWLPATKLMPPIWKHKPRQIATPLAEHAVYGIGTVAGYRWLKEKALG